MYYLYLDTKIVCQWCKETMMQIIEDELENVVVKLCPVCDRYPPDLLHREIRP